MVTPVPVEVQFAQKLASNDPTLRNKAVKKIKKWFSARTEPFSEAEMMRLWKGLYYCYWMSDKPLVQEELAENMSSFISSFKSKESSIVFIKSFLSTFGREWFGIDRWRVDKFMMFTRRFLRSIFKFVAKYDWQDDLILEVTDLFEKDVVLCPQSKCNIGFKLHVTDVFLEELAKVANEHLATDKLELILKPFLLAVKTCDEDRYRKHVVERIFKHLLRQSDPGIKWQDEEFEDDEEDEENVENGEESSEDEEDGENKENDQDGNESGAEDKEDEPKLAEDPRAGGVHSVIPQLQVNYSKMSEAMFELGSEAGLKKSSRDALYELSKMFKDVANDVFPLGPNLEDEDEDIEKLKITKTAKKIIREADKFKHDNLLKKMEYKRSLKENNDILEDHNGDVEIEETNGELEDEDASDTEEAPKVDPKEVQRARKREQKKRKRERLQKEAEEAAAAAKKELEVKEINDKIAKDLIDYDLERKSLDIPEAKKRKEMTNNETNDENSKSVKKKKKKKKDSSELEISLPTENVEVSSKKNKEKKSQETVTINTEAKTNGDISSKEKKKKKDIQGTDSVITEAETNGDVSSKKKKKKRKREIEIEEESIINNQDESPSKKKKQDDTITMKIPTETTTEALETVKEKKKKKKLKKALYRIDSDIAFNAPSLSQSNLLKKEINESEVPSKETCDQEPLKESNQTVTKVTEMNGTSPEKKKKSKKMKKYNAEASLLVNNQETPIITTEPTALSFDQSATSSPKSGKSKKDEGISGASPKSKKLFEENNSWAEDLKPGETEIFIPNKKYKGDVKVKESKDTITGQIPGCPSPMVTPAKSFTATFLKKAMSKSEKKAEKKSKSETKSMTEPRKKKVNVVLTKNVAQDFAQHLKSVKNSPQTPHDPNKNPVKSALKKTPKGSGSSEKLSSLNPVNLNTQLNARSPAAKKLNGKNNRKRAMDFF